MKKKQFIFIIVVELLIILCFAVFFLNEQKKQQHTKELFINKIYFLLTDISNNLNTMEGENSSSFEVCIDLAKLDAICKERRQATNGAFYYADPGMFEKVMNNIVNNSYNQSELTKMASDIQTIVQELSDSNGIAENSNLSYKELNNILELFYNSWE